jgi:hypothetical protein
MRQLLAKDVRLVAPYAWLVVPVHVLWCAQAFLVPDLYFWMSLAAVWGWTAIVAMLEWRVDADRLLCSLPVTRATIVRARYLSALAALAIGATLYLAYGHALTAVASARIIERWHGTPGWASAGGVAAFLIVGFVVTVGFLPFYFRFGLPLGAASFAVVAAVGLSGTLGLARLAHGSGESTAGAASAARLSTAEAIRGWLSSASAAWGIVPLVLALAGAAILATVVSARLSIRFYETRDL